MGLALLGYPEYSSEIPGPKKRAQRGLNSDQRLGSQGHTHDELGVGSEGERGSRRASTPKRWQLEGEQKKSAVGAISLCMPEDSKIWSIAHPGGAGELPSAFDLNKWRIKWFQEDEGGGVSGAWLGASAEAGASRRVSNAPGTAR